MTNLFSSFNKEIFSNYNLYVLVINIVVYLIYIFLNKEILEEYGFPYALILTSIQFVFSFLTLWICLWLGLLEHKQLPLYEVLPVSLSYCSYISLSNLSLMLNPAYFYQFMGVISLFMLFIWRMHFYTMFSSLKMYAGFVGVGSGLWIVITNSEVTFLGITVALASVITGILYDYLLYKKLNRLKVSAIQILPYQLFISSCITIPLSFYTLNSDIFVYPKFGAQLLILLSLVVSVFANISCFASHLLSDQTTNNIQWTVKMSGIMLIFVLMDKDQITLVNMFGIILTAVSIWCCSYLSKGVSNLIK
ncbi:unnamed protein product [Phytomonas sp. Hart1]|nr:unnamed protein product [Phytomonas sp. Hart1]|eukprot:CCW71863.1 unnamed protein product [Phytomonas sp. isolate Hart1]